MPPHTSLGGLRKTTLATKLCWDEHAKSKPNSSLVLSCMINMGKFVLIILYMKYGLICSYT